MAGFRVDSTAAVPKVTSEIRNWAGEWSRVHGMVEYEFETGVQAHAQTHAQTHAGGSMAVGPIRPCHACRS